MTALIPSRRLFLATGLSAATFACSARPDQPDSTPVESAGTWRTGPALPYAVQEIYPALHQGRIHLAGGFIAEDNRISGVTDRHIALDLNTGSWSDLAALPVPRHHPNLISFDGALIAIGGFEARSEQAVWVMQAGTWVYEDDAWRDGPTLPQPNGESVSGVIDNALHLCGGRQPRGETNANWNNHTDVGDHFVLTDLNGTWAPAAPLPTARNSAASAVIDDAWHVAGGRTVSGGNTAAHEVYDVREDRWRTAAPMPQGQAGLAAATVNGTLYAFGGEFFDNGGGVYPEAWAYDPGSDSWTTLPDMPNPRHGLGGVAVGEEIYVIGGALKAGGEQTSPLVEIYSP